MWWMRAHDDAGRPVRIGGAALRHALARWAAGARRASWVRAAQRATLQGTLPLALGTAALLGMILALSILSGAAGLWLLLFTPVFTSLVFPLAIVVAASERLPGLSRQAAIRAALMLRRCPACDYDLSPPPPTHPPPHHHAPRPFGPPSPHTSHTSMGVAADARSHAPGPTLTPTPTTRVTCPECGAAWHAGRIGDDAPEYQPRTVVIRR
ncbi:MAG: hypothetical protein C0475_01700 [Planctomyces sp.]|nr:hypothetical protein [Planctomyces sp.]